MLIFSCKGNASIHSPGEDDTASFLLQGVTLYLRLSAQPPQAFLAHPCKTPDTDAVSGKCRASVGDAGQALTRHWISIWSLLHSGSGEKHEMSTIVSNRICAIIKHGMKTSVYK